MYSFASFSVSPLYSVSILIIGEHHVLSPSESSKSSFSLMKTCHQTTCTSQLLNLQASLDPTELSAFHGGLPSEVCHQICGPASQCITWEHVKNALQHLSPLPGLLNQHLHFNKLPRCSDAHYSLKHTGLGPPRRPVYFSGIDTTQGRLQHVAMTCQKATLNIWDFTGRAARRPWRPNCFRIFMGPIHSDFWKPHLLQHISTFKYIGIPFNMQT